MSAVLLSLALQVVAAVATKEWSYVVNDLFDDSLEQMAASLKQHNDGYVELKEVVVGGYTLQGARIGDLTALRRNGNITLSSAGSLVTVSGSVELPNMIVRGGNVTSLESTINNPTVTFNGFDGFSISFWFIIQNKKCENGYPIERSYWTRGTVLLTSDTEQFKNVDISKFIQLYEHDISEPIESALSGAFSDFFGFCDVVKQIHAS
ncbi:uncharacterized protein [Halyomorpha halys]|uniref:uncharacterized protein n=1 Tax=Halyomorpha halys TaxID=286706 RepID=UPI0006D511B2|nr:uncharacterized protein LOC106682528 [Halyomorpha halys]